MSFAILGGVLLNIGAYLTYRGRIYQAVIIYIFADLCWIALAYEKNDYVGAFFIVTGTAFGFLAYLKMKKGKMNKSLHKEENIKNDL